MKFLIACLFVACSMVSRGEAISPATEPTPPKPLPAASAVPLTYDDRCPRLQIDTTILQALLQRGGARDDLRCAVRYTRLSDEACRYTADPRFLCHCEIGKCSAGAEVEVQLAGELAWLGLKLPESCISSIRSRCLEILPVHWKETLGMKEGECVNASAQFGKVEIPSTIPESGKQSFCAQQSRQQGSSYHMWREALLTSENVDGCELEKPHNPWPWKCGYTKPHYECADRPVTYEVKNACVLEPFLVSVVTQGFFADSTFAEKEKLPESHFECYLVYQPPKFELVPFPEDAKVPPANRPLCTTSYGDQVIQEHCKAVAKNLNEIAEQFRVRVDDLSWTYGQWYQWAQVMPNPRFRGGWHAFRDRKKAECVSLSSGATEDALAQAYFQKNVDYFLKDPARNPQHSWTCCAPEAKKEAAVPAAVAR